VNNRYEWAFCKGGALGEELWPMVLEKAYAKLNGAYEFIEAGKVHYALADMVGGFPQQIDLKKDIKNTEVFWEKLISLNKNGALMGAGSPENPMGDAAINQNGIVQGHAYSVLDTQDVDGFKLIKMRNPHGRTGAEWRGDWSDICPNWNQRMKNKLKYEPITASDHAD
jgi:calpain-15